MSPASGEMVPCHHGYAGLRIMMSSVSTRVSIIPKDPTVEVILHIRPGDVVEMRAQYRHGAFSYSLRK